MMTSEHGPRHRWDAARSRCLDCGRDAEEIADELGQQLQATQGEIDRLRRFMDPNKSGATALLAANREIESLHYQLANVQRLVHGCAVRGEYVEEQLDEARALITDYIAAITRRAPELATEPAPALFSLDDEVAMRLYQRMRAYLEKYPQE